MSEVTQPGSGGVGVQSQNGRTKHGFQDLCHARPPFPEAGEPGQHWWGDGPSAAPSNPEDSCSSAPGENGPRESETHLVHYR